MTLDNTGFGWIAADGKRFDHDIVVLPGGRVENRYDRLSGPNHLLEPDEARRVLDDTTADFVLGTGQYGLVRVPKETARLFKELGVRLHRARTPESVRRYNGLPEPRCGVFHVTC